MDRAAKPDDLKNIEQTLDLWSGLLVSKFEIDGVPVRVQTCCHPTRNLLAVRVESPLISRWEAQAVARVSLWIAGRQHGQLECAGEA